SAGGIHALQEFFRNLPAETGMAFVVIPHLAPDVESSFAEILAGVAAIPVRQVHETVRIEPDHAYVVAPNQRLTLADGCLAAEEMESSQERLIPIDAFFRRLASEYRRQAACVVLSGTGSDGTQGLKRIKEMGGLTLVQAPEEAEYDGMPRSALITRMVDCVLPVAEMPARLQTYQRTAQRIQLPASDGDGVQSAPVETVDDAAWAVRDVLALIRSRTGQDFSQYKRPTILRRIARRMQVNGFETIPEYLDFTRGQPAEVQALQRDLLISVTDFFRDPAAWESVEAHVIPKLFEGKKKGEQVRVWVAGCATGEEAYSVAILLTEYAERLDHAPSLQVFATDLDEEALRFARDGLYEETIAADMSPERLRRFFTREHNRYRVRKDLREKVLFAWHNILRDPPFSRLDLVTCRNLLIYLNREMQERVLETFHFALRPEGYLLLGFSETADEPHGLFVPLDKKQRIFRRRTLPRVAQPFPSLVGMGPVLNPLPEPPPVSEARRPSIPELYQRLLEQHGPPSVLVNREHEIVYSSARAGRFLRWAGGEPSHDLTRSVHPELRLELHSALYTALQQNAAQSRAFGLQLDGKLCQIQVTVHPVAEPEFAAGYALVTFRETDEVDQAGQSIQSGATGEGDALSLRLEEELRRVRTEMRTTLEQYETTVEELRASNEELQAMNEELRA
ncbi:MAG TPA: CheR family methyltransferase, partial [Armatimonadota bacterium]|nr:CheR family methyltransferase [Armatimonadota bacterium]